MCVYICVMQVGGGWPLLVCFVVVFYVGLDVGLDYWLNYLLLFGRCVMFVACACWCCLLLVYLYGYFVVFMVLVCLV